MRALCLLLAFGAAFADEPQAVKNELKTKERNDHEALQGTWSAVSLMDGSGAPLPPASIGKAKFVFAGDTLTFDLGFDNGKTELSYRLDPHKNPREITFAVASEKSYPSIYRLEGDTLQICICGLDRERPQQFAVAKGSKFVLVVLKRDKK